MPAMSDTIKTIQIRNPRVIEVVLAEKAQRTGRSAAETAENLILSDAERRRVERARRSAAPDVRG